MNAAMQSVVTTPWPIWLGIGVSIVVGGAVFAGLTKKRPPITADLYEVLAPDGGGTPEQFFMALHGMLRPWYRRLIEGQPWIGLELYGARGRVRFGLWIPHGQEPLVRHLLQASYPGIELRPLAADPLSGPPQDRTALASVRLAGSQYLPLGLDTEGDTLASLLATLARPQGQEGIAVSILVRPRPSGWQGVARRKAAQERSGRPHVLAELLGLARSGPRPVSKHQYEKSLLMEEKARKLGFDCAIRVMAVGSDIRAAREHLRAVSAALRTFHGLNRFSFRPALLRRAFRTDLTARRFPSAGVCILNTEELAALWHFPVEAPHHLEAIRSPKLPPPVHVDTVGRMLGTATYPGSQQPVALSIEDSRRHLHVLGPTGAGKTTLLTNLILQDLQAGRGVGVIDPKGDLVEAVLERLPRHRINDVVLIAPDLTDTSIGINPMEWSDPEDRDILADNVLSIFKRIYEKHWGMRTDDILKASLLTLLRRPDTTICHIPLILTDPAFRGRVLQDLDDPIGLEGFWHWYERLSEAQRLEAIGPVLNKLRDFLVRPRVRRLLCQSQSTVDLGDVINRGGVLLVNLSVGRWGEQTSSLLGSFLFAKIWQEVRQRSHLPESARRDFLLYVDEFQQFLGVSGSFADTLAQARSFRLSLTLANQHLGQLPKEIRDALSSNARSRIAFQAGQEDARYLAREFAPMDAMAMQSLPRFEMVTRLSIGGETSRPFTVRTDPLPPITDPTIAKDAAEASRARFGRPVEEIDQAIAELVRPTQPPAPTQGVGRRPRTP